MVRSDYSRDVRWLVAQDRVKKLGESALDWFTLQFRRFERILSATTPSQQTPVAVTPDRTHVPVGSQPERVRNWLVANYLRNPLPDHFVELNSSIVYERFEALADHLLTIGADVLSTLEMCRLAGWIEDIRVVVPPAGTNCDPLLPQGIQRLNLPVGDHRVVGILSAVLNGTRTDEQRRTADPDAQGRERTQPQATVACVPNPSVDDSARPPTSDLFAVSDPGSVDPFEHPRRVRSLAAELEGFATE